MWYKIKNTGLRVSRVFLALLTLLFHFGFYFHFGNPHSLCVINHVLNFCAINYCAFLAEEV